MNARAGATKLWKHKPPRSEPGGRGRVVLVSPANHAQHAKVRAEEQRVSEHADTHMWVSTSMSEQLVETAKTLTQPRPRIAQVM